MSDQKFLENIYHPDVLIFGAGFSGLSTALWCHSQGLSSHVLEIASLEGGQLNLVYHRLRDYPGFMGVGGELKNFLYRQVSMLKIPVDKEIKFESIDWEKKLAKTNRGLFCAKALVVAMGLNLKKLNVPGEDKFLDKSIRYSASKDFFFFKNKTVAIIGSGDGAVENALLLLDLCPKIYLVVRGDKLKARGDFVHKLRLNKNKIEVIYNEEVTSFEGEEILEKICLSSGKKLTCQRSLIKIGFTPQTQLLANIYPESLSQEGHIKVNSCQETLIPGIWAVGDVCTPQFPSLSVCAGQSSVAAKSIAKKLHPSRDY